MPAAMPTVGEVQDLGNALLMPNNIMRADSLAKIFGAALHDLSNQGVQTSDTITTDPVVTQGGANQTDVMSLIGDIRRHGFEVILDPVLQQFTIRWPRT